MGTMTVEQIFLLYDELTGLQHIAREAEQWGVRVQIVGTIGQCLSLASAAGVQAAFALSCQADKVFLHINRLRVVFPAAGIIVVRRDKMAGMERGHLMLAGADACFDREALPVEVVACVQALRRRGYALRQSVALAEPNCSKEALVVSKTGPESDSSLWELMEDGWTLLTPRGQPVMLTRGERRIVLALFALSPQTVARVRLFLPEEKGGAQVRSVDVVISRLKRKLWALGEELPIRSVRGQGYAFVGSVPAVCQELARESLRKDGVYD